MREAIQKKGRKGKDKDLIIQTIAKQHMSSHHWMSASGIVKERAIWAGPMFAKHVIVPILIILIVIVEKVIISNIFYRF